MDLAGHPGVGQRRELLFGHLGHLLDGLQDDGGADRAVEADHVRAPAIEHAGRILGVRAVAGLAVVLDGHLGEDGQIRAAAHRLEGLLDLAQVREGLEHEAVHPAVEEPLDGLDEERLGLGLRGRPVGFQADPQGPDGTRHVSLLARRLAGDLGGAPVDALHLAAQAVALQVRTGGAEGVGLEHLGPGPDVGGVDRADQIRLLEVQLVVAAVDEDALGIEHRAHGPVEDDDPVLGKQRAEVPHGPRPLP
ncbi:hypothetical protein D3C86_1351520 [compost metagenome]